MHPELAEELDVDVDDRHPLEVGAVTNTIAAAIAERLAEQQLDLAEAERLQAEARDLRELADAAWRGFLHWRLRDERENWRDMGGELCPVCSTCVRVDDDGRLLEPGLEGEPDRQAPRLRGDVVKWAVCECCGRLRSRLGRGSGGGRPVG